MPPPTDSPIQPAANVTPGRRAMRWLTSPLARYFALARGASSPTDPAGATRRVASPQARCLLLALIVTGLLTTLGVTILNDYHVRAHYHFDSAAYRYIALHAYQTSKGARWATVGHLL